MINRKKFDFVLLALLVCLITMGCIAIFSASTTVIGQHIRIENNWWKQIIFAFVSLMAIALLIRIPMPIFDIVVLPLFIMNLLALVVVLFTPAVNGSHRWFSLGGINLQPSESAKLLTILMVARIISREHLTEYRQILYGFLLVLLPVALIIIEPDFGTTLVFWTSLMAMLIAADVPIFYVLLIVSPIVSIVCSIWLPIIPVWLIILILLLIRARLSWVAITVASIINVFISLITPYYGWG